MFLHSVFLELVSLIYHRSKRIIPIYTCALKVHGRLTFTVRFVYRCCACVAETNKCAMVATAVINNGGHVSLAKTKGGYRRECCATHNYLDIEQINVCIK